MPKEKLPKLSEAQVRGLANDKSFERGESYFQEGAIVAPIRQGLELRAECRGSEYEPYQISVTLDAKGVSETDCTCPYDWGGICKHRVALLLAYVHTPEIFRIVAPLDQMLADKSKEELIAIIQNLLKHKPDLLGIVDLTSATQETKSGRPINVSAYRAQARRAMQNESPRQIERELKTLKDSAAQLANSGDALNAGAVYHALLDEAVNAYDELMFSMDEDGDIAILVDEFAKGLGKCLKKSKADTETRRDWLETLLRAELTDIELGGIDLAPSAIEAVLKHASRDEWLGLEDFLREKFSADSNWAHETIQAFVARGRKKHGIKL